MGKAERGGCIRPCPLGKEVCPMGFEPIFSRLKVVCHTFRRRTQSKWLCLIFILTLFIKNSRATRDLFYQESTFTPTSISCSNSLPIVCNQYVWQLILPFLTLFIISNFFIIVNKNFRGKASFLAPFCQAIEKYAFFLSSVRTTVPFAPICRNRADNF